MVPFTKRLEMFLLIEKVSVRAATSKATEKLLFCDVFHLFSFHVHDSSFYSNTKNQLVSSKVNRMNTYRDKKDPVCLVNDIKRAVLSAKNWFVRFVSPPTPN